MTCQYILFVGNSSRRGYHVAHNRALVIDKMRRGAFFVSKVCFALRKLRFCVRLTSTIFFTPSKGILALESVVE